MSVRKEIIDLQHRMSKEIIGQEKILECILIGVLSNGNILVEGQPGLAKTRAIKALANNIEGDFSRIQFTPDLVATDITGKEVYYKSEETGESAYKFVKGPIFGNIVLADEINRAPPKSQNALLEAMEERQVTIAAVSHKVPDLFMVMATMNPVEQEGVFHLPEAQKDRFLMHISVEYPDEATESGIIRLVRDEESQAAKKAEKKKAAERIRTSQETIFAARDEIDKITVPDEVEQYIVDLVFATRYPQRYTFELKSFLGSGASPRASIGLDRVSRAHAWLKGQEQVSIENVQAMIKGVLRHRLVRGERAVEHKITTDEIIQEILELVPTPDKKAEIAKKPKAVKMADKQG